MAKKFNYMKKTLLTLAFASMAVAGFAQEYATGTAEAPLTVEEFIAGGAPADKKVGVENTYVKGYIVGYVNSTYWDNKDHTVGNTVFGVPTAELIEGTTSKTTTNIVLAGSSSETDYKYCFPVSLPATAVRDELNLYTNPQNLGHEVILCGSRQLYMSTTGMKNITSYTWVGEAPKPGEGGGDTPDTPVTSDYIYEGLTSTDAECTWTFVDNSFQKADGTEGTVWSWKTYNGAFYLNGSSFAGSAAAALAYAVSPVVDLTNATDVTVVFEHAARFQTNLTKDDKFVVREVGGEWQEVAIPTWPTAGAWTFVSSGDISLKAFEGKKVELGFKYVGTDSEADTWEIRNLKVSGKNGAGVAGIEADAEAVYFNLSGVRVAQPEKGLYIRVANGKASKVVVK